MSKLYFYYGTVCSSKTLNLLAVYKNYEIQGRKALLIRPDCDTRSQNVESRAGISAKPDIVLKKSASIFDELVKYYNSTKITDKIPELIINSLDAIIVDECQFLSINQVKELRLLATGVNIKFTDVTKNSGSVILKIEERIDEIYTHKNEIRMSLPILCYGLRTDSTGTLWPASSILMAQSDEIHEIKTVCSLCNKRAVFSSINPEYLHEYLHNEENEKATINPSWNYYVPMCPEHYFFFNKQNKQQE